MSAAGTPAVRRSYICRMALSFAGCTLETWMLCGRGTEAPALFEISLGLRHSGLEADIGFLCKYPLAGRDTVDTDVVAAGKRTFPAAFFMSYNRPNRKRINSVFC